MHEPFFTKLFSVKQQIMFREPLQREISSYAAKTPTTKGIKTDDYTMNLS